MLKLKFNHFTKIITIKNQKFIPHKLHQLPKNYEEISKSQQFSHKGFCYINSNEFMEDYKALELKVVKELYNEIK